MTAIQKWNSKGVVSIGQEIVSDASIFDNGNVISADGTGYTRGRQ